MAYRGETTKIRLIGDDKINLSSLDFVVAVYPDRDPDDAIYIEKVDMVAVAANEFVAKIDPEQTSGMSLGLYTIEVLVHEDSGDNLIFAKRGAFPMYDSASKNII